MRGNAKTQQYDDDADEEDYNDNDDENWIDTHFSY